MNNKDIVKAVYDMLMSQSFADWYNTDFIEHVEDPSTKSVDEICSDISKLLNYFNKEL